MDYRLSGESNQKEVFVMRTGEFLAIILLVIFTFGILSACSFVKSNDDIELADSSYDMAAATNTR